MNTKNLCEEEITLAPQTEIFEEAKRIAAESAGDATDSFVIKYDDNQKDFLIAVLTELGCMITAEKDETNTMIATMNMEQAKFLINLECVKNIHKVLIRNYLQEEILAARAAEKEESVASAATPMMLSANEEEGVAVASVQTTAATAGSSMATAISLPLESWVDGCVCCPENDWIWYKFTVPSNAEKTTYTVHTRGSFGMDGILCNSAGTVLASDNDGIKCKMVAALTKGATYYVKLKAHKAGETGGFYVRVTNNTIVDSLSVQPQTIVLKTGVTYELPITIGEYSSQTDDTYPLVPITVSAYPASPTETRVFWGGTGQSNPIQVVDDFYEIRKDEYNKYTTVRSDVAASTTLYVYDWYQYGIRGTVNVFFTNEGGQVVRVNANNGLALRESAGDDGEVLGTLENRTMIALVDETPVNEKWYHVYGTTTDGSSQYGWCSGEYLEKEVTFLKSVCSSNINVRHSPTTSSEIIGKMLYGYHLPLLKENAATGNGYNWHKILFNDLEGYVFVDPESDDYDKVNKWVLLAYGCKKISEEGIAMLKTLEGYRSTAYKPFFYETLWTIGYGHLITDGGTSVTIDGITYSALTEALADTLLRNDMTDVFEPRFNNFLQSNNVRLNQYQYDACIMDAYQKGQNIWQNGTREIVKFILADQNFDDYDKVLTAFIEGATENGWINRRTKEARLFVQKVYS